MLMKELKRKIKELGLRQMDIADQLGMNASYLNRLLNGKQNPPPNFETRLSLALTVLSRADLEAEKARWKVLRGKGAGGRG